MLPYTPLRAKKGLATPLLVAAAAPHGHAQRVLAREDVPELEVGASGLPLHALPASVRHRALRWVCSNEQADVQGLTKCVKVFELRILGLVFGVCWSLAREDVPELEVGASGLPLHALPAPVR